MVILGKLGLPHIFLQLPSGNQNVTLGTPVNGGKIISKERQMVGLHGCLPHYSTYDNICFMNFGWDLTMNNNNPQL